ncbi:MAG: GAF domain-containing protein, partial [Chloroflexi bacterium]|nr:GAF domain-containing protein [Chloroflexota bacterium]
MATKAAAQISPWGEFPYLVTALEELLGSLLETVISATSASEGSIMLLHEGRELLTVNSARGPRQDLVRNARHYLGEGISGWVAKTKEPLLLVGSVRDDRFPGTSPQVKDAMCVPLMVEERVIGVLSLSNKKGAAEFTPADLDQLVEISKPVARVIDTALAQRESDAEASAWARRQLAQEIHDGILQSLSSLLLHLRLYEDFRKRDPSQAEEELERSRSQAEEAL